MIRIPFLAAALALLAALAACESRDAADGTAAPAQAPAATAPASADATPDQWLGKWTGPEGTSLDLAGDGDHYSVAIQSLDGPATYEGTGRGDRIEFQRSGRTETIRATSGQETGMKWLAEKADCLTINTGEGFCRD